MQIIKIGDHILEVSEKTIKSNQYPVLTSSQDGLVSQEEYFNKQIASKDNTGYKIIRKNQFTYRAMSDTGRFYINQLLRYDSGIVSPAYPVFEVKNDGVLFPPYLRLFFRSEYFQALISTQSTGSTRVSLKLDKIKQIEISVPEYDEQVQIVKKVSRLKAIIGNRGQQLSKYDDLVKSQFIEMFGAIPKDSYAPLDRVCNIITDGTHQPPKFSDSGIPFLFVSNLANNEIDYQTQKFISKDTYAGLIKRTPIQIGDVLLSTVGSYGHPAVVTDDREFCFQRHIAYLKPNAQLIDSRFLYGALLSPIGQEQIERAVKGIAQKTLNLSEIRKIRVPLPSCAHQKQYSAFYEQTDKSKDACEIEVAA